MPAIVRLGDTCSGHSCFPPRANSSGSPDVFVDGLPVHRVGDSWATHGCTHNPPVHGIHDGTQGSGSPNVFANGRAIARVGDSVSCGSSNASGSPDVFANG